ncbi:hypothetical protein TWF481_010308 [Arthrobotrys musiformis]|uniref:Uncharacterized protein n=1 Tax=Arthrobotrys musiformis TaxID=47236 RepID=A0AAV9W0L3_9PEZI
MKINVFIVSLILAATSSAIPLNIKHGDPSAPILGHNIARRQGYNKVDFILGKVSDLVGIFAGGPDAANSKPMQAFNQLLSVIGSFIPSKDPNGSNGPVGNLPNGPVGNFPNGPVGNLPNGPVGNIPNGQFPNGQLPNGPVGNLPNGQFPSGPVGNIPTGQIPNGQIPNGPIGNLPTGLVGNVPTGPVGAIPAGPNGQ